jgi:hypothetical protein
VTSSQTTIMISTAYECVNQKLSAFKYLIVVNLVSPMSWGLRGCLLMVNSRDHGV